MFQLFCHQWLLEGSEDTRKTFGEGIIHTVSPYDTDGDRDEKLYNCYSNCIKLADYKRRANNDEFSIATTLLGTGVKCVDKSFSATILRKCIHQIKITGKWCNIELVLQSSELGEQILSALQHEC